MKVKNNKKNESSHERIFLKLTILLCVLPLFLGHFLVRHFRGLEQGLVAYLFITFIYSSIVFLLLLISINPNFLKIRKFYQIKEENKLKKIGLAFRIFCFTFGVLFLTTCLLPLYQDMGFLFSAQEAKQLSGQVVYAHSDKTILLFRDQSIKIEGDENTFKGYFLEDFFKENQNYHIEYLVNSKLIVNYELIE